MPCITSVSLRRRSPAYEAASRGVDGLICGHIQRVEITPLNGVLYCNSGDWVESCTALVERKDGSMELVHWSDTEQSLKQVSVKPLQAVA